MKIICLFLIFNIKSNLPRKIPEPKKSSPKQQNFDSLRMHPVIKELKFLLYPKSFLEPIGDRFLFTQLNDQTRGGEAYFNPDQSWIRYGLKIKSVFPDIEKWLAKDGNVDEWCVLYQGFKFNPLRTELYEKLFDKNNFCPKLKPSLNYTFARDKNINKNSDTFGQECGIGIFTSNKPDLAEKATCVFELSGIKYKMLLQCRADPKKVRIPQNSPNLRIVNSSEHIRPYGVLIKQA